MELSYLFPKRSVVPWRSQPVIIDTRLPSDPRNYSISYLHISILIPYHADYWFLIIDFT